MAGFVVGRHGSGLGAASGTGPGARRRPRHV